MIRSERAACARIRFVGRILPSSRVRDRRRSTLATLAVGAAVLFGVYKVVELLGDEPVEKRRSSSDATIVAETASAGESAMESSTMPTEAESLRAPALEE